MALPMKPPKSHFSISETLQESLYSKHLITQILQDLVFKKIMYCLNVRLSGRTLIYVERVMSEITTITLSSRLLEAKQQKILFLHRTFCSDIKMVQKEFLLTENIRLCRIVRCCHLATFGRKGPKRLIFVFDDLDTLLHVCFIYLSLVREINAKVS